MNTKTLEAILRFREERDWKQFHSPKNLAISIAIEAAELMEIFQWPDAVDADDLSQQDRDRVREEIADVAIYMSLLAHDLGLDLDEAIMDKVAKNALKYPAADFRGRYQVGDGTKSNE